MKKNAIFALLFVIGISCDDEDSVVPEKTSLLTLTVESPYLTTETDNWIVVHSEDGTLLAFESFEPNQELELVTDKSTPGKISVTEVTSVISNGNHFYNVTTYVNVEKGKHMFLKTPDFTRPGVTGELNVSISNVSFLDHQSLTSRNSNSGGGHWDGGTGILDLESSTYAGITKHIVTVSDGNVLRHKVMNNVQPGDSYSFSLYDMDPFDQTVDFTFPQTNDAALYVSGSDPDATLQPNNYDLIADFNDDTNSTIKAGYLNSLTNYTTRLNITYPDYAYEYLNIGSIPGSDIAWPQKSDFTIKEKSISNFSATTKKSFIWRYSTWSFFESKTVVFWNVAGSTNQQSIGELPSEITSVHPALALSNMVHSSTAFYTESVPYNSYVDNYFAGKSDPAGLRLGIKILTK